MRLRTEIRLSQNPDLLLGVAMGCYFLAPPVWSVPSWDNERTVARRTIKKDMTVYLDIVCHQGMPDIPQRDDLRTLLQLQAAYRVEVVQ